MDVSVLNYIMYLYFKRALKIYLVVVEVHVCFKRLVGGRRKKEEA